MEDKYGLKRTFENLTDEAKEDVLAALKRAENKLTVGTIAAHWREIVIGFLVVASIFMWNRWDNSRRELAAKEETFNRLQKIEDIDKTMKVVRDRQETFYPKLDEMVGQIEAARGQINKLEKKIKVPVQSQFQNEAKKLTLEELSVDFKNLGYPNTIVK